MGIGQEFHEKTCILEHVLVGRPKLVPEDRTGPAGRLSLPPVQGPAGTLDLAIRHRRSVRDYSPRAMTVADLSQLLFAAYGQTRPGSGRSAPSAGALYPLDLYLVANRLQSIPAGIYRYLPEVHGLEQSCQGDLSSDLAMACLGQHFVAEAAAVFVMAAEFERTCRKYGQRGYRYAYIEAGHISQNIYLQATALGLGSVAVGAFFDQQVNEILGLDGKGRAVIYLHAVGYPAGI